jgi:hypothetical protein
MTSAEPASGFPDLFTPGDAEDKAYVNLRDIMDVPEAVAGRSFCERLWTTFHPDADAHFLTEIRRDFAARFWEMYLTCALRHHAAKHDYAVTCPKRSKGGPDVLIEYQGRRIWIEAITVTDGDPSKPDAPVEANRPKPGQIPDEQILLRYTTAISAKHQKLLRYRETGIAGEKDAYVIAMNAYPLTYRWAEPEMPRFLKALYPLGHLQFIIDRTTGKLVETRHEFRDHIAKKSGTTIPTTIFLDKQFAGISAVLHSYAFACMKQEPLGLDFLIAHNPLASEPVPLALLPSDREFTAEIGDDECKLTFHKGVE